MAILTNSGRTALAIAVKNSLLHLAWGRGRSWWDEQRNDALSFDAADHIALPRTPVAALSVKSADETVTYAVDVDYTVSLATGVITRLPGGNLPEKAAVRIIYRTPRPSETPDRSALFDEIGRNKVTEARFVVPNPASGQIVMTTGRFDPSDVPTPHLLVRTTFGFDLADGETIRETAVFLETVAKAGVPLGTLYLKPDQVEDPGTLLVVQYTAPILRNGATEQSFQSVLTF